MDPLVHVNFDGTVNFESFSNMTVRPTEWQQWLPDATISCVCASNLYVCAALEYANCVVLRLWPSMSSNPGVDHSIPSMPDGCCELSGHIERVVCMAIHGDMLCSASSDCILVWRIQRANNQKSLQVTRHMLVDKPQCEASAVEFDASGGLVAIAFQNQIEVLTVQTKAVYMTLEGHLAKITAVRFDPLQPHVLITASEDRTFKVWDLADAKLIYQSAILSAHAILTLAINPATGDICCGFADGTMRFYHKYATEVAVVAIGTFLAKLDKKQQIAEFVDKTLEATQNVVSSLPPWARSQQAIESAQARSLLESPLPEYSELPLADVVEVSCTILAAHFVVQKTQDPLKTTRQGLVVGTTNYAVFVDALSYQVQVVQAFQSTEPVAARIAKQVAFASYVADSRDSICDLWISSAFAPCLTRLQAVLFIQKSPSSSLSILPQSPPPPSSILLLPALQPAVKSATKSEQDKPVTFHTKIKSSGYGPSSLTNKFKRLQTKPKSQKHASRSEEYMTDCRPLTRLLDAKPKWHTGAINRIEYSTYGTHLASASNDHLAQIFSTNSLSSPPLAVLVGHNHYVQSVRLSHSSKYVLTTSADKSARVWCIPSEVASIDLPFTSDVADGSFYYQDKFIVVAHANKLKVMQYFVDAKHAQHKKKSDLERLENHSRTKTVATYTFESLKSITSVACANATLSHLLVVAGSDKSVRIVDAAVGKTARVIPQAHATRAPHSIVLPTPSSYVSHPSHLYDLLLTAACDNSMHLWDIRADNCVLRLGEHANRVHAIGAAFSPCMRYIATGSEEKVTHLYDIRTGRTLDKLRGHTDVVSSVAFHPVKPLLATAAVDGTVRLYGEASQDRYE
ncbi:hypothetical protein AeRB84_021261 [Aphanomyces euteiches]|nr:hypothetical protein AeRB84_021261 [Aphanomyces euteiches]